MDRSVDMFYPPRRLALLSGVWWDHLYRSYAPESKTSICHEKETCFCKAIFSFRQRAAEVVVQVERTPGLTRDTSGARDL